jgi:hypothetical protein
MVCSLIPAVVIITLKSKMPPSKKRKTEYAVAQLVEELRYKPEGRGFDSRSGI